MHVHVAACSSMVVSYMWQVGLCVCINKLWPTAFASCTLLHLYGLGGPLFVVNCRFVNLISTFVGAHSDETTCVCVRKLKQILEKALIHDNDPLIVISSTYM